jgi:hypothetical protein
MACCIFLKSLRILERFRKNPNIKIPPASPCRNSQSLAKFQNPLEIANQFLTESSPSIWPDRPNLPCNGLPNLQVAASSADPLDMCVIGIFLWICLTFGFLSFALAPSLLPLADMRASLVRPSSSSSCHCIFAPLPASPCPKLQTSRHHIGPFTHHLDSPLKYLLKQSWPSMPLITLKLSIDAWPLPPPPTSGPYKRRRHPTGSHHTHRLSFPPLLKLEHCHRWVSSPPPLHCRRLAATPPPEPRWAPQ